MASNTHRLGMLVSPTSANILPSYDPEAIAKLAYEIIIKQRLEIKILKSEIEKDQEKNNKLQIELISEINDYLNINKLTNIGNGSIFHKQCQNVLKAQEKTA
ncbi:MAG: hypothetical protein JKY50_09420 [Oleispira sp.]|nr:hypothetical protein [Oleispira sp.]